MADFLIPVLKFALLGLRAVRKVVSRICADAGHIIPNYEIFMGQLLFGNDFY